MKLQIFLLLNLFLFLECKKVDSNSISKNSTQQAKEVQLRQNADTAFNSTPLWKEASVGNISILKDFPEYWSHPSILSDDYDELVINKFSKSLKEIGASFNLTTNKNFQVEILDSEVLIIDKNFKDLSYPIKINNDNLLQLYKLNDKYLVGIFKQKADKSLNNISKRVDLLIFDSQFSIIDKINILFEGNGDQHAFMKYFYISNEIIQTREFYVYDGESSALAIKKYSITDSGKISDSY